MGNVTLHEGLLYFLPFSGVFVLYQLIYCVKCYITLGFFSCRRATEVDSFMHLLQLNICPYLD